MAKFTNVSGRDLLVNSRRTPGSSGVADRVGGARVKAGQVYDLVADAEDVGDAYLVGDRLYPKKHWALVQPVKKSSSGKAFDAEPDSEKE